MVTQEDIATLESAIYSGIKKVKYKDRETEYRDLDEMKRILADMKSEISQTARTPYTYASYSRRYQ